MKNENKKVILDDVTRFDLFKANLWCMKRIFLGTIKKIFRGKK